MAAALEHRQTVTGENIRLLRQFLAADFHDRQVRHVWPLLDGGERPGVQSIVQFLHAVGTVGHPDEDRRSHGDEGFDIPESDLERLNLAADIFESLQRRQFPALQPARRKDGHMSGQMGQIGMKYLPKVLNKFPDGIPYVGHQGITGILHVNPKLYLRKREAWVTT